MSCASRASPGLRALGSAAIPTAGSWPELRLCQPPPALSQCHPEGRDGENSTLWRKTGLEFLAFIPNVSWHKIMDYPEWEGARQDHQIQLLFLANPSLEKQRLNLHWKDNTGIFSWFFFPTLTDILPLFSKNG